MHVAEEPPLTKLLLSDGHWKNPPVECALSSTARTGNGMTHGTDPQCLGRGSKGSCGGLEFWNLPGIRSISLGHVGLKARVIAEGRPERRIVVTRVGVLAPGVPSKEWSCAG